MTDTCRECRYFDIGLRGLQTVMSDEGHCRRYPPTPRQGDTRVPAYVPLVNEVGWCGEWDSAPVLKARYAHSPGERTVRRFQDVGHGDPAFDLLELRYRSGCDLTLGCVDMMERIQVSRVGEEAK